MRFKFPFGKTFVKLYVSFVLIIIALMTLLGYISYNLSGKSIEHEITKHNIQVLRQINKTYEQAFKNVENTAINLLKNQSTLNFINESSDIFYSLYKLSEEMSWIVYNEDVIKDIYIYSFNNRGVFSAKNGFETDKKVIDYHWIQKLHAGEIGKKLTRTNFKEPIFLGSRGGNMVYLQKIPLIGKKSKGYIIFVLDEKKLWESLSEIVLNGQTQLYMLYENGSIISSNQPVTEHLMPAHSMQKVAGSKEGYFFEGEKNKTLISFIRSSPNGRIYVAVTDLKEELKILNNIRNSTIIIIAMMSIAAIIISYPVSRKIYNPIEKFLTKVNKADPDAGISVGKKKMLDEFKYLTTLFDDVTVSEEKLKGFYNKNKTLIKEKIINDLLRNRIDSRAYLMERLHELEISLTGRDIFVMVMDLDHNEELGNGMLGMEERQGYLNRIRQMAEEVLADKMDLVTVIDTDQNIAALCNMKENMHKSNIVALARQFKQQVFENLNISISIGIGNICHDLMDVSTAYLGALRALKYRLLVGNNTVIHVQDIRKLDTEVLYYYPVEKEKIFINLLESREYGQLEKLLEELVLEIKKKPDLSVECVLQIFNRILSSAVNIVLENGGTMQEVLGSKTNIYTKLAKNETIDDIKAWVLNICKKIIEYLHNKHNGQKNKYVEIIKVYIQNNYSKDITLDMIAARVGLSRTYVSKMFKECEGVTLVKYINRTRIEQSKAILTGSNLSIREISERVGYNNEHGFIRYFKIFEGITPGQYRGCSQK